MTTRTHPAHIPVYFSDARMATATIERLGYDHTPVTLGDLRAAWKHAHGTQALTRVTLAELKGTLRALTHRREDDLLLSMFVLQGQEVHRSGLGMNPTNAQLQAVIDWTARFQGPLSVLLYCDVQLGMEPDFDEDHDWERYQLETACGALTGYRVTP